MQDVTTEDCKLLNMAFKETFKFAIKLGTCCNSEARMRHQIAIYLGKTHAQVLSELL